MNNAKKKCLVTYQYPIFFRPLQETNNIFFLASAVTSIHSGMVEDIQPNQHITLNFRNFKVVSSQDMNLGK